MATRCQSPLEIERTLLWLSQCLNKAETAAKYAAGQVKVRRCSFDICPPALDLSDNRCPCGHSQYCVVNLDQLTLTESLKDTIARVVPYFEREIKPQMGWGRRIIMAAHGSFLRTLVKYFEDLTPEQILEVNIPTGVPLVYEFDRDFRVVHKQYLGNAEAIVAKINSVANQGRQNVP